MEQEKKESRKGKRRPTHLHFVYFGSFVLGGLDYLLGECLFRACNLLGTDERDEGTLSSHNNNE